MSRSYDHIYLSPHYDDAAFSCGGAIHRQVASGQAVLVLTLCAAAPAPDAPRSPLAQALHTRMGGDVDPVAVRRAEDAVAMQRLGVHYRLLPFMDCIYRGRPEAGHWYYTTLEAIFGTVHPAEALRPARIAAAVAAEVPEGVAGVVHAPLGVGDHVDHQVVFAAAEILRGQGWHVVYYEDFPYAGAHTAHPLVAGKTSTVAERLGRLPLPLTPQLIPLSDDDAAAWVQAALAYASQLPLMFGDPASIAPRLAAFAGRYRGGGPCERRWIPAANLSSLPVVL